MGDVRARSGSPATKARQGGVALLFDEVAEARRTLGKPEPLGPDIKASDEFLDSVFRKSCSKKGRPEGAMWKTDYHTLAPLLSCDAIAREVVEKLDAIAPVATRVRPMGDNG
jgi:hypothetical protein